jgi:DNA-binding transcriptional LysR family regulator
MDRHFAMQCFCRVVQTGSFAAASRDLDLSRSVVTKYIQFLEEWTGSRLLERTTRTMQLTDAGARFYAYCRRVIDDTEATLGELRDETAGVRGRVVVSSPVSLGLSFLAEHFHAFQQQHPCVELELRLDDHTVDLVREGVDLALRGKARLDDSSLVAVPLMEIERVVCASPAFWREHGLPAHPRDLPGAHCLPYLLGQDALQWTFAGEDGRHTVDVKGRFRANNSLLLIDAMQRGLGVALVPKVMVRQALRDGSLVPALVDFRTEPRRLFAVYPSREHLPARVRALVEFLKDRLPSAGA